jgi:lysophospholipase L1-like esterase
MTLSPRHVLSASALATCVVSISLTVASSAMTQKSGAAAGAGRTWVTAWATSQQALGDSRVTNATVRMIGRVTIPGDTVRVRLDNAFGSGAVTIGAAYAGLRVQGAALAQGSSRKLSFNGAAEVSIPAGGSVWSDAVRLPVTAQQDLAVSLYVPGMNVQPSQHTAAVVTSYRSADGSGNVAADDGRAPFTITTTSTWWLKAIEVETAPSSSAVVAFGDSITDGTCSTLDAHDRWEDVVSVRLGLQGESAGPRRSASGERLKAVVNEGIGGNTITREGLIPPADSTPGLERFDRDVLSHHGVTEVVVFMGTNDIRRGASAAQVIAGTSTIVQRIKAKGMRAVGATIIPRHNVPPNGTNTGWNAEKTRIRNEVNQWIRTRAPFDDVIDFDKVVRDPANADVLYPAFNCGDGIHPSPSGYFAMGTAVDLSLFSKK